MTDAPITHVSDTALWVAYYRHMESVRPDAIFRDPFAERLAGEQGRAIVDALPRGRELSWAMIVRTKVFDEVILDLIAHEGVDLVINLAAGLDARPWRLDLPASLRWVDVDFPPMVEYKSSRMAAETPRCRYEAVAADLSDAARRPALLAKISAGATRALIVAEGLLIYLTPEQVTSLARDLAALPAARWWLIDLASPQLLKWMSRSWGRRVSGTSAQFKFAPEGGTAFFAPTGWRERAWHSATDASQRLNRGMRGMKFWLWLAKFYPKRVRERWKRFSGYALLERSS